MSPPPQSPVHVLAEGVPQLDGVAVAIVFAGVGVSVHGPHYHCLVFVVACGGGVRGGGRDRRSIRRTIDLGVGGLDVGGLDMV